MVHVSKLDHNLAKQREQQIDELFSWAEKNTDLKKFSNFEIARFFFSDRENIPSELSNVSEVFDKLKSRATEIYHVGNYVAYEYAMSILLKLTKGVDIVEILKKLEQDSILIQPPITNAGKFKLIQKTITQLNDENLISNEKTVIERLVQKEGFTETIAIEAIKKALKIGAITKNNSNELGI